MSEFLYFNFIIWCYFVVVWLPDSSVLILTDCSFITYFLTLLRDVRLFSGCWMLRLCCCWIFLSGSCFPLLISICWLIISHRWISSSWSLPRLLSGTCMVWFAWSARSLNPMSVAYYWPVLDLPTVSFLILKHGETSSFWSSWLFWSPFCIFAWLKSVL